MPFLSAPVAAAVSLAGTLVSTAMSVVGALQQGDAAKKQAAYQAGVARNNQILAERAAKDARARGEQSELSAKRQQDQLIARQRAALAANGVLVDQDSALDITSDTAMLGKLNRLTILSNAEREALGYEAQGSNFNADAQLAAMRGENAVSASRAEAAGSIFKGATTVASKWYDFDKQGVWG